MHSFSRLVDVENVDKKSKLDFFKNILQMLYISSLKYQFMNIKLGKPSIFRVNTV